VTIFTGAILYPFLTMVILAGAFAVVLTPVYLWMRRKVARGIPWLASALTVATFLIIMCIPLFFVGSVVFEQAQNAYQFIVENNTNTNTIVSRLDISINKVMPNGFVFDTSAKVHEIGVFLSNNIARFFTSTFNSILMFILMVLTIFYLLKDGDHWKKSLMNISPLSENHMLEILSKLKSAINRILRGSFLIAIIQGVLISVGFTIFGVPSAALWGVVAGVASFIPTFGTSIVSIPAILFLFFSDMRTEALGLLIWSGVLIGLIDNALSPYFISKNTEIPSLFILFSILGGISLMGPLGVLIGPLVLSLLYSLVSIYRKEIAK
jgi:predicted PurR-regulated permease PerM